MNEFQSNKEGIIVIGPPGSGKTSHTTRLGRESDTYILRGRDILPEQVSLYEKERELIPEEMFIPGLNRSLNCLKDQKKIIFDNIPRSRKQAEVVVKWSENNRRNLATISLELEEQEVARRFTERLVCPSCNASYHNELKPPKNEGKCDDHGDQLVKRLGDKLENVSHAYRRHLELIEAIQQPLEQVGPFYRINAIGRIDHVFERIAATLNLRIKETIR